MDFYFPTQAGDGTQRLACVLFSFRNKNYKKQKSHPMFETVTLEPYKTKRLEKSVSRMGLRSLDVGPCHKKIEMSVKISMFEGADFSNFRKS